MPEHVRAEETLKRGIRLFVAGLGVLFLVLLAGFWDRSNVIEQNCVAINGVKESLVGIIDRGQAQSLEQYHTAKAQGIEFPGFNPRTIRESHDKAVRDLEPSEC
jgi:AmiR/NasT family two-component response regulator